MPAYSVPSLAGEWLLVWRKVSLITVKRLTGPQFWRRVCCHHTALEDASRQQLPLDSRPKARRLAGAFATACHEEPRVSKHSPGGVS